MSFSTSSENNHSAVFLKKCTVYQIQNKYLFTLIKFDIMNSMSFKDLWYFIFLLPYLVIPIYETSCFFSLLISESPRLWRDKVISLSGCSISSACRALETKATSSVKSKTLWRPSRNDTQCIWMFASYGNCPHSSWGKRDFILKPQTASFYYIKLNYSNWESLEKLKLEKSNHQNDIN